jgi:hypothetical protein
MKPRFVILITAFCVIAGYSDAQSPSSSGDEEDFLFHLVAAMTLPQHPGSRTQMQSGTATSAPVTGAKM